jgi:hypothetical protein
MKREPRGDKKPADEKRPLHESTLNPEAEQEQEPSDDDSAADFFPSEDPTEIEQTDGREAEESAGNFEIRDATFDTGGDRSAASEEPTVAAAAAGDLPDVSEAENSNFEVRSSETSAAEPFFNLDPIEVAPVDSLLNQPTQPVVIDDVFDRGQDADPSIRLLDDADDRSPADDAEAPELSQRAEGLQAPTSDGGPPLARPIINVTLNELQLRQMIEEVATAAGQRDALEIETIAEEKVGYAFWLRDCEDRALWGDD